MAWAHTVNDSSHPAVGSVQSSLHRVHVDSMVAILVLVTRKLLEAAMVLGLAAEVAGAARHHGGEQS